MCVCERLSKSVIYEHVLGIKFMCTTCEIILGWMPLRKDDDKSKLVHVMAWCRQALPVPILTLIYVAIWRR